MTVTKITDLERSQPTTDDNPVWRIARDFSKTALTAYVNFTPVDGDGNAITKDFIVGITRADGYTEEAWVTDLTANVLTFGARGIKRGGLDYTTGVTANAVSHRAKEEITMVVSSFDLAQFYAALNGDIGSGKKLSKVMTFMETGNTNARVFADTATRDAALPTPAAGWGCYVSGTGLQVYSGSAWTTLGTATPTTASNGVQRVTDDFQLNLDTDSKLVITSDKVKVDAVDTSAGATEAGKVVALDSAGKIATNMFDIASQAEAEAGTDNTKVMTPLRTKQSIDELSPFSLLDVRAGDNSLAEANTERSVATTTYTMVKEIEVVKAGTYRITWDAYYVGGFGSGSANRIYKNGVAFGLEVDPGATYSSQSQDLVFSAGDMIQLYIKHPSAAQNSFAKNFVVSMGAFSDLATVNQD